MTRSGADETLTRVAENLEILTEQVGRMTEGLTKLENLVTNGFTELKDQAAARDIQINRLIGVVEQLISRP